MRIPVIAVGCVIVTLLAGCSGSDGGPTSPSDPDPVATVDSTPTPSTGQPGTAAGGPQNQTGGQDARTTTPNPNAGEFGATCATDSACTSQVCFLGGHGGFCSAHCAADAECPTPSSGAPHCNPHGYCRY